MVSHSLHGVSDQKHQLCQLSVLLFESSGVVEASLPSVAFVWTGIDSSGSEGFLEEVGSVTSVWDTVIDKEGSNDIHAIVMSVGDVLTSSHLPLSVSVHSYEWGATIRTCVSSGAFWTLVQNMVSASLHETS